MLINDSQDTTQQTTNETQTSSEVQNESGQTVPQAEQPQEPKQEQKTVEQKVAEQPRKNHSDRIAELESKIARMEAIYQLQGQNVVDLEVCTDLLMKGYTLDQLKQSKPYLFGQQNNPGVVRQPPKVVAETQIPKSQNTSTSSESFVKTLANMLVSKF